MEQLYEFFTRKLKSTPTDFLRYKYNQIKVFGDLWVPGEWANPPCYCNTSNCT